MGAKRPTSDPATTPPPEGGGSKKRREREGPALMGRQVTPNCLVLARVVDRVRPSAVKSGKWRIYEVWC